MEPILAFLLGVSIMVVIGLTVKFVNNYITLKNKVETLEDDVEILQHDIRSYRRDFFQHLDSTSRRFDGVETQIENTKKVQKIVNDLSKSKKKLLKG
jgi:uncharacterized membrane-anchored protein YhcB (DUF1043 family)